MSCPQGIEVRHHDSLRLELMTAGRRMHDAIDDPSLFQAARERLVGLCVNRLLPHLDRDDQWLRRAEECEQGGLLAEAMRSESRAIAAAVLEIESATQACEAVGAVRVLHALLAAHAQHEERLVAAISH